MAYGSTEELTICTSATGTPSVARARNILAALDYAYNIAAVVELTDQGHLDSKDLLVARRILQRAPSLDVSLTNHALGALIEEDAQLSLLRIETGSPFIITVGGIADIIAEIRKSLSPTERAKRKEALRHAGVMNQLEEAKAALELQMQFDDYLERSPRFNKEQLPRQVGEGPANDFRLRMPSEWARAIDMARTADAETVEDAEAAEDEDAVDAEDAVEAEGAMEAEEATEDFN
ncbi:hypothetical protein ABZ545_07225 [Streptomyces abikoensis]|uniref:hypothetical protein n=1 Tax=Streptomyces abikoensis TaxID=97398 RepID=UPI0033D58F66